MPAEFDCHLTQLDDATLAQLSSEWQERALQNQEGAQGIAAVLEAEAMRRQRFGLQPVGQQSPSATPAKTLFSSWRLERKTQSA